MALEWRFLTNEGQEEEGLGHAGIETFKGSPFPGIARESAQNSLDACPEDVEPKIGVRFSCQRSSVGWTPMRESTWGLVHHPPCQRVLSPYRPNVPSLPNK